MQPRLQLQLLLVFRSGSGTWCSSGRTISFLIQLLLSTHSYHLHNPQFLPLLAIIPLECYEKLNSRFALEHRYGSVLSRSTRTSSTEQHRVHTHCECGHAVCQVFQLSASSDGIFCNRCMCCGPETRVPTSFWTDHCRRETSDEFRCGQVKEIACSAIFGMLWSNRSCGRARVVPSSSSGLHEIRNTGNENGRHDPSRSRDCVLLESVCVSVRSSHLLHSNSCRIFFRS